VIGNPTSRDYNKASVLDVVLSRAPLTRNELIDLTGFSKATVSRAVEELRADGFIVDGGLDEVSGRGRRSTYLDLPGTTGHVVGVSFGVQSTGVMVADLRGRELHHVVVLAKNHQEADRPRNGWSTWSRRPNGQHKDRCARSLSRCPGVYGAAQRSSDRPRR
jgi:hypothetical protein